MDTCNNDCEKIIRDIKEIITKIDRILAEMKAIKNPNCGVWWMEIKEVNIVNLKQVSKYVENGVQPIRIRFTDRLVFVFDKKETSGLFDKWVKHLL